MEGTLRIGDRVLVDKLAYRFGGTPQRGDVIVFDGDGSFTQSAWHGLREAGDRHRRRPGHLLRQAGPDAGERPSAGRGLPSSRATRPRGCAFDIVVPDGRLWVMGDHRDDSRDSRDHLGDPGGGTVPVGG